MKRSRDHGIVEGNENLSEMLNDCSIDRVMAIDLNWNIIAWNKTSEIISGIPRSQLLGKNLLDAFPQILQDQEMLDAITQAFNGRKSFLPSNASSFNRNYSENHFIPLRDDHDNVVGVMNIIHDVAHRIKVEKQLQKLNAALEKKYRQLEKANLELATFTSITSQSIKEPLKHVYTSLELLVKKEGQNLSNMSKGNLRRMQGSLNKMNLLLDDILTVAGLTNNEEQRDDVDLNEVIKDVLNKLRHKVEEHGARIEVDNFPVVSGYPRMLQHLIHHLIDNAIKFHQEGVAPVVNITCQEVDGDETEISDLSPDHAYVKICVVDNGIGFAREDAERIFELFEKLNDRQYHGSGIGLTICKKVVELHEGYIHAEASPGNGAAFYCYLPVE